MDKIAKVKKNLQLQQWAQMVTERQSAGMTVAQWCEHEQISQSVYYYRLRKVRQNGLNAEEYLTELLRTEQPIMPY